MPSTLILESTPLVPLLGSSIMPFRMPQFLPKSVHLSLLKQRVVNLRWDGLQRENWNLPSNLLENNLLRYRACSWACLPSISWRELFFEYSASNWDRLNTMKSQVDTNWKFKLFLELFNSGLNWEIRLRPFLTLDFFIELLDISFNRNWFEKMVIYSL